MGAAEVFEPIILQVAAARMGREFCCIESFNDHPKTLRRDVVAVLRQTREEIVAGKFAVPGAETVMPAVRADRRVGNHGSWPATLWRRLFACN